MIRNTTIWVVIAIVWGVVIVGLSTMLLMAQTCNAAEANTLYITPTTHLTHNPPPGWHGVPVPTTLTYVPARVLPALCRLPPGGLVACAAHTAVHCTVYVAEELSGDLLAETLRHEQAHCEGYHHDGP